MDNKYIKFSASYTLPLRTIDLIRVEEVKVNKYNYGTVVLDYLGKYIEENGVVYSRISV